MVAKYIVLSNIISVLSAYNILCIYIQENLLTLKRFIVLLDTLPYHHITAYWSAIKFTRLIPGNVCLQDETMVTVMYNLMLIQHHVLRFEIILQKINL